MIAIPTLQQIADRSSWKLNNPARTSFRLQNHRIACTFSIDIRKADLFGTDFGIVPCILLKRVISDNFGQKRNIGIFDLKTE